MWDNLVSSDDYCPNSGRSEDLEHVNGGLRVDSGDPSNSSISLFFVSPRGFRTLQIRSLYIVKTQTSSHKGPGVWGRVYTTR